MTDNTQTDWYTNMSSAMKRRDHAIKMIAKWTDARTAAESDIQQLFLENTNGEAFTDQATE